MTKENTVARTRDAVNKEWEEGTSAYWSGSNWKEIDRVNNGSQIFNSADMQEFAYKCCRRLQNEGKEK